MTVAGPIADVSALPLSELVSLRGRGAVVTGAAHGLGLAIAHRLADAGAAVLLADSDPAVAEAREAVASAHDAATVEAAVVDCRDEDSLAAVADRAVAALGGLHVWITTTGAAPARPLAQVDDAAWDELYRDTVRACFLGARLAARRMLEQGERGCIVTVAPPAGERGSAAGLAEHVATRQAVEGMTKNLALELGPQGIRVLAVAPTLGASGPGGRAAVPDDVARVVVFCATDAAILMTGSTLQVDGGYNAV